MTELLERLIDRIVARAERLSAAPPTPPASNSDDTDAARRAVDIPDYAPTSPNEPDSHFLSEVAQTMGVWDVTESHEQLRRLIPKHGIPALPRARASGIWSLGFIYADKPDYALAEELNARLYDTNPLDPEAFEVRLHSAIAIGRMRASGMDGRYVEFLRVMYNRESMELKAACRWAIMHMTDEVLPELTLQPGQRRDGFIQPID